MSKDDGAVLVVGLGGMGLGMARCLSAAGFTVRGADLSSAAVDRAAGVGIDARTMDAAQPLQLEGAAVVLCCVPADPHVRDVTDRVAAELDRGRRHVALIEASTVLPATLLAVSEQLAGRADVVDVSLSGGPEQARAGSLTVYVGGLPEPGSAPAAVLQAISETLVDCGEPGRAKLVKLLNNTLSWAHTAVAAEVLALGADLGLDPQWLYGALAVGNGRSHQLEKRFGRLLSGDDSVYFTVAMGRKDIDLAARVSRDSASPTPLLSVLQRALHDVDGEFDQRDIATLYEHYRQVAVRHPGPSHDTDQHPIEGDLP